MREKLLKIATSILTPKFSKEEIDAINKFKRCFKIFFEGGYEFDQIYISYIAIHQFEITDLKFRFQNGTLHATVVLRRCGMLIGRNGATIDALNEYMSKFNTKVHLEESDIWRDLK